MVGGLTGEGKGFRVWVLMNDYGKDPLGNGLFRMVPSGDILTLEEAKKRLSCRQLHSKNDCLGLSWEEIERIQGGKLDILHKKVR